MNNLIEQQKRENLLKFSRVLKKSSRTGQIDRAQAISIAMSMVHIIIDTCESEENATKMDGLWETLKEEFAKEINKKLIKSI